MREDARIFILTVLVIVASTASVTYGNTPVETTSRPNEVVLEEDSSSQSTVQSPENQANVQNVQPSGAAQTLQPTSSSPSTVSNSQQSRTELERGHGVQNSGASQPLQSQSSLMSTPINKESSATNLVKEQNVQQSGGPQPSQGKSLSQSTTNVKQQSAVDQVKGKYEHHPREPQPSQSKISPLTTTNKNYQSETDTMKGQNEQQPVGAQSSQSKSLPSSDADKKEPPSADLPKVAQHAGESKPLQSKSSPLSSASNKELNVQQSAGSQPSQSKTVPQPTASDKGMQHTGGLQLFAFAGPPRLAQVEENSRGLQPLQTTSSPSSATNNNGQSVVDPFRGPDVQSGLVQALQSKSSLPQDEENSGGLQPLQTTGIQQPLLKNIGFEGGKMFQKHVSVLHEPSNPQNQGGGGNSKQDNRFKIFAYVEVEKENNNGNSLSNNDNLSRLKGNVKSESTGGPHKDLPTRINPLYNNTPYKDNIMDSEKQNDLIKKNENPGSYLPNKPKSKFNVLQSVDNSPQQLEDSEINHQGDRNKETGSSNNQIDSASPSTYQDDYQADGNVLYDNGCSKFYPDKNENIGTGPQVYNSYGDGEQGTNKFDNPTDENVYGTEVGKDKGNTDMYPQQYTLVGNKYNEQSGTDYADGNVADDDKIKMSNSKINDDPKLNYYHYKNKQAEKNDIYRQSGREDEPSGNAENKNTETRPGKYNFYENEQDQRRNDYMSSVQNTIADDLTEDKTGQDKNKNSQTNPQEETKQGIVGNHYNALVENQEEGNSGQEPDCHDDDNGNEPINQKGQDEPVLQANNHETGENRAQDDNLQGPDCYDENENDQTNLKDAALNKNVQGNDNGSDKQNVLVYDHKKGMTVKEETESSKSNPNKQSPNKNEQKEETENNRRPNDNVVQNGEVKPNSRDEKNKGQETSPLKHTAEDKSEHKEQLVNTNKPDGKETADHKENKNTATDPQKSYSSDGNNVPKQHSGNGNTPDGTGTDHKETKNTGTSPPNSYTADGSGNKIEPKDQNGNSNGVDANTKNDKGKEVTGNNENKNTAMDAGKHSSDGKPSKNVQKELREDAEDKEKREDDSKTANKNPIADETSKSNNSTKATGNQGIFAFLNSRIVTPVRNLFG